MRKNHQKIKCNKNRKIRCSKNQRKTKVTKSLPIFSANGAGVVTKIQSLLNNITELGAGLITLQETHFARKGKLNGKICDFEIFEAIRKKQKGGTLIGAHRSLDPVLIEEYSEDFELLVVEVRIGTKDVRIISGYGP